MANTEANRSACCSRGWRPSAVASALLASAVCAAAPGAQAASQPIKKQQTSGQIGTVRTALEVPCPAPNKVKVIGLKLSKDPKPGETVQVLLTIKSLCTGALSELGWKIGTGTRVLAQGVQRNVPANGQFEVKAAWQAVLGDTAFYGQVDPLNRLAERVADRADNIKTIAYKVPPRPFVVVGGFSNCPRHFDTTPLVAALQRQRGAPFVKLTTHRNAWGDIDENAVAEAGQIVAFMDDLRRRNLIRATDVELDAVGFSMGGLVLRAMLTKHPQALGRYKLKNLVTMATPNHGANPTLADIMPNPGAGGPSVCPNPTARYETTIAARQMMPLSPFLTDLNRRAVPREVAVHTIAGEFLADTATVANAFCDASCSMLQRVDLNGPVPAGTGLPNRLGTLDYQKPEAPGAPQWQGGCEIWLGGRPTGQCKADTTCPPGWQKRSADGVWKCNGPGAGRITTGQDGLVRVLSVRLSGSEAQNIVGQHVIRGIYHTGSTQEATTRAPNPKLMTDARGARPDQLGHPMVGSPVTAKWFFDDPRVTQIFLQLQPGAADIRAGRW